MMLSVFVFWTHDAVSVCMMNTWFCHCSCCPLTSRVQYFRSIDDDYHVYYCLVSFSLLFLVACPGCECRGEPKDCLVLWQTSILTWWHGESFTCVCSGFRSRPMGNRAKPRGSVPLTESFNLTYQKYYGNWSDLIAPTLGDIVVYHYYYYNDDDN